MICGVCGREIFWDEIYTTVNEGLQNEYVACECYHDSEWDGGSIVMCEGCGRWFSSSSIPDEEVHGESFAPCPICGKDIVEGLTAEEIAER